MNKYNNKEKEALKAALKKLKRAAEKEKRHVR
jgi:hypothetical protein